MLGGGFVLPQPVTNPEDFAGVIARDCHKVFSVVAEAGNAHTGTMHDGGFFLPLLVIELADFGGIISDCHKAFSVEAEAGVVHPATMLNGGFFLPLLVIKLEDFGGITRGCHTVFSVGAVGTDHAVSLANIKTISWV